MKILNINVNNVREYFQAYYEIIRPFTKMTKKEAQILATIIEIKHNTNSKTLDWRHLLKENNLQYMLEINNIKKGNLEVILSSLKKKKILYKNQFNENYLVPFEEEGGIIFSIKMRNEDKD